MPTRPPTVTRAAALATALCLLQAAGGPQAQAQQQAQAQADEDTLPAKEQARALFDRAQTHYTLGEYQEAVILFRKAYELAPTPLLLYNVAQAQRLAGDCKPAIEAYRHFVRLEPDSPHRADAERHIADLTNRCGTEPPTAPPVRTSPPAPLAAPAAAGPTERVDRVAAPTERRRLGYGLLGVGAFAGGAALALHLWNRGRYSDWRAEDERLEAPLGAAEDAARRAMRQEDNDDRLRSIKRVDRAVLATGAVGVACLVGAALVPLWPKAAPLVAIGPSGAEISWRATW